MPERRDAAPEAPKARSKSVPTAASRRSRHIPDLRRLLADFRTGLGKLRGMTQKLMGKPLRSPAPAQATRIEHRELLKTLEREVRILERTAPAPIKDRIVREFRTKAAEAIQLGVPQAYAEMSEAARIVPSKALRPNQTPAVKSLLQAVKAIKAGRLAFLPRQTRAEARKLLRGIFGSPKSSRAPTAPQRASVVQQERLLPLVVQGMMRSYERPEQYSTYIDAIEQARTAPIRHAPASESGQVAPEVSSMSTSSVAPAAVSGQAMPTGRAQSRPLDPLDLKRLEKAGVPAFKTTGVAHAFTYEPDESVHTIDKNDGLVTEAEAPQASRAPVGGAGGAPPPAAGRTAATPIAPTAVSGNVASAAERTQETLNVTDKPAKLEGTLKIDGLSEFIGDISARVSGLERRVGNDG